MNARLAVLALLAASSAWAGPLDHPLIKDAYYGDVPSIERRLAAGDDVNARDDRGMTALMWAAYKGNLEAARVLLQSGADPRAVSDGGATALKAAAQGKHSDLEALLVSRGAASKPK